MQGLLLVEDHDQRDRPPSGRRERRTSFTFMKDPFQGAATTIILHGMAAPQGRGVRGPRRPRARGRREWSAGPALVSARRACWMRCAPPAPRWSTSPTSRFLPFATIRSTRRPATRRWSRARCKTAADEMTRAMAEGFTVVLGGDCTLVAGVVAGARRHLGQEVGPRVSGRRCRPQHTRNDTLGVPARHGPRPRPGPRTCGGGRRRGTASPICSPTTSSLVGFRALDPAERAPLGDLGLALPAHPARRLGMTAAAAPALDGVGNGEGPIVVHVDVDVIDPKDMPAKAVLAPGEALGFDEVSDLLTRILASPRSWPSNSASTSRIATTRPDLWPPHRRARDAGGGASPPGLEAC